MRERQVLSIKRGVLWGKIFFSSNMVINNKKEASWIADERRVL
jgi:hypothetical protein